MCQGGFRSSGDLFYDFIMIIDTHSHLYDSAYNSDFQEMILRVENAGVGKCIMPGIDSSYHERMMQVAEQYPDFAYPCIGLHPTSVNGSWRKELLYVKNNLASGQFYAVGEIGLDGYWSREFMKEQKEALLSQLLLAEQYSLPVIIHLREATEDIFEVLDRAKSEGICFRGVFHAYTGSLETYHRILKYGDFKIGIGGVVTYKNAGIASVLKEIPNESILLETDAPWLTPVPFRGKRNESSYLPYIVSKVAQIKETDEKNVMEFTTKNALDLFKLR